MTIHYDEKGKYFSDVVSKTDIRATIQTRTHRIDGHIFLAASERPKDALNVEERFLAVKDAVVYDMDGNVLKEAEFMAVNREHIIWVIPHEDLQDEQGRIHDDPA